MARISVLSQSQDWTVHTVSLYIVFSLYTVYGCTHVQFLLSVSPPPEFLSRKLSLTQYTVYNVFSVYTVYSVYTFRAHSQCIRPPPPLGKISKPLPFTVHSVQFEHMYSSCVFVPPCVSVPTCVLVPPLFIHPLCLSVSLCVSFPPPRMSILW